MSNTTSQKRIRVGGELNLSLTKGYELNVLGVLKEGLSQTVNQGFGLFSAILAMGCIVFALVSFSLRWPFNEMPDALVNLLLPMALAPFIVAPVMLGVQQAVGIKAKTFQVLDYLPQWIPATLLLITIRVLLYIVDLFFNYFNAFIYAQLLVHIVLLVSVLFAIPLVLDRRFQAIDAIKIAMQLFLKQWWKLLLIHSLMVATGVALNIMLVALSLHPLLSLLVVIGVILPWFCNVQGILYRNVCGIVVSIVEHNTAERFSA